jgi:hypothetical protein
VRHFSSFPHRNLTYLFSLPHRLTTAITIWTVGYCIGQIPSNLLLTKISPRWWIPSLELLWGVCTLFTYKVTSVKGLYTTRFFVGLAEYVPISLFVELD